MNQDLENTAVDIPKVFGASSAENQQLAADTDSFKDAETADYVGISVHCAPGSAFCADAKGVKFGQTSPTPTATADLLPDEPGGYPGSRPCSGTATSPRNWRGHRERDQGGYQVTNAAGNLVDLNGNQINGAFLTPSHPGFPGFGSINASQTLAYMSDMLESGLPVVNGYISDIHGNEHIPGLSACSSAPVGARQRQRLLRRPGAVLQPGVRRVLPAPGGRGHHPEEHRVPAQLGRGRPPGRRQRGPRHPAHPGQLRRRSQRQLTVPCTYPTGSFGELAGNLTGLLATQKNDTTPFTLENDTAPEFYVTGKPPRPRPGAQARAGRRRPDRGQPVHRHHPEHHQLPGRPRPKRPSCTWSTRIRPARRRSRCSPSRTISCPAARPRAPAPASPRTPGSPGTTVTTPPRSTPTSSASPGPGSGTSAWTAPRPARAPVPPAGQRPDHRPGQRHEGHLDRRDRHPADPALPDRAARRLPDRRPGHLADPHPHQQRAAPGRGHRARGLLQAAELQRGRVRHGHPPGLNQGHREHQRRRHHLHPHRSRPVRAGAGP